MSQSRHSSQKRATLWLIIVSLMGVSPTVLFQYNMAGAQIWTEDTVNHRVYPTDGTNSVGIGTGFPAYKLHVVGDLGVDAGRQIFARYSSDETYKAALSWNALQLGNNGVNYIIAGRTATNGSLIFVTNNTNDFKHGVMGHNGIEAMTLTATGNVGIGTASPEAKLDVVGDTRLSGNLSLLGNYDIISRKGLLLFGTTDGSSATQSEVVGAIGFYGFGVQHGQLSFRVGKGFELVDRSTDGPTLGYLYDSYPYADLKLGKLFTTGNIGIGTTSPAKLLTLYTADAGTPIMRFQNAHNAFDLEYVRDAGGTIDRLDFNPGAGGAKVSFLNNGNVGIGTMNPGTKLDVAGDIRLAPGQLGSMRLEPGTVGAYTYTPFKIVHTGVNELGFSSPAPISTVAYEFMAQPSSTRSQDAVVWILGKATSDWSKGLQMTFNGDSNFGYIGTLNDSNLVLNTNSGRVGIGTSAPTAKLHVEGDVVVSGNIAAKYQDVAEWVTSPKSMPAGTVVILDVEHSNQVLPSVRPYDTRVAGVISDTPGLLLGEAGEDKVKVATTGRVKVKVDATKKPIHVGDLLVTSDKEGIAMKSEPLDLGGVPIHRPGTLIGKALEALSEGEGEILVLLSLQ